MFLTFSERPAALALYTKERQRQTKNLSVHIQNITFNQNTHTIHNSHLNTIYPQTSNTRINNNEKDTGKSSYLLPYNVKCVNWNYCPFHYKLRWLWLEHAVFCHVLVRRFSVLFLFYALFVPKRKQRPINLVTHTSEWPNSNVLQNKTQFFKL